MRSTSSRCTTRAAGFRVDRADARLTEALDLLVAADAWTRVERALHDGLARQLAATPGVAAPDALQVVLLPGDPADTHSTDVNLGMTANGSVPGYLWICLWPSPENLERIEATAVHELHHDLRYRTVPWDPMTTPVGEQIAEGLADAFASQLYGDLGYTRIGLAAQGDDAVFATVVANLGVTGMQHFAAWVHGDATAARFGAIPVGLPTGAVTPSATASSTPTSPPPAAPRPTSCSSTATRGCASPSTTSASHAEPEDGGYRT